MGSFCRSIVSFGADGLIVDIECHLSNNLPTMVIVGFAGRTIHEAKDRLRGAFASSQLELPRRRITINLAPADIPKADSGLDLAIATAILVASDQVAPLDTNQAVIGELSLDGNVRPVRGLIGKLLTARSKGLCSFFVPLANLEQARLVPGIELLPVANLRQLYDHLTGNVIIVPINTGGGDFRPPPSDHSGQPLLSDVVGQDAAKQALIIAAAGGHNVLLSGPPGTGKSMLAKALTGLLPPMSHEEILEVTHLHSLASNDYEQLTYQRPLRSPHHSTSHNAMMGGGRQLKPGEISLSHRGVLFLDEFLEFSRDTLESLRQPLEDRYISVVRTKDQAIYPANFILLATANPCPCGYYGYGPPERCGCSLARRKRYENKLSGPILDRIDLCCSVYEVDHKRLLGQPTKGLSDDQIRAQIAAARQLQAQRHGNPLQLNSDLTNRELKQHAKLTRPAVIALQDAAHRFNLSARGYMRSVKVARTVADLEGSVTTEARHIQEALAYRRRPAN